MDEDLRLSGRRRARWAVAAAYALLVLAVSSVPSEELPVPIRPGVDKVLHFAEYLLLGVLVGRAAEDRRGLSVARFLVLFAVCAAFAAFDELHQGWIPGRTPSVWDWAADAVGIASGLVLVSSVLPRLVGGG